ncbi:MAG: carboxymuconolactone decarboxylase family protein [Dehalococcoidia bacterium]|nr:carboxymuconolactone decarboxylase family protein [Dehalococcoidia bacterium]
MPRLAPLDLATLDPEQKRIADAIIAGPRGGMRGPFEAWLRSPGLCEPAQQVGAYCRFGTSLSPALSELVIMLTGRHWRAQFEFWAHANLARQAGVSEEVIEAIRTGQPPAFGTDEEHAIYDFLTEYFATNRVSDATYARAKALFGEKGVVDIIGIAGYYGLVSMTLNVFQVALPEGEPRPFDLPD